MYPHELVPPAPGSDRHRSLEERAEIGIRAILELMGRDPDHPSVRDTPARWVKAYTEMGTHEADPATILERRFAVEDVDSVVTVGPIDFVSLCEHHLLPFTGRAWVAYKPTAGQVVGLSKIPRLVRWAAQRPQIQERMTEQITAALNEHLPSDGAACVIEGEHSCMSMRGVRVQGAKMITSSLTGLFREDERARAEFLSFVHR